MSNNRGPYFVWSTKAAVTRRAATEIDEAVKAIDPGMTFVRHYQAGNETHGWLERANDGSNDTNPVRSRNNQCIAIAKRILGAA